MKLTRSIQSTSDRTDSQCDELKEQFKVNDTESDIPVGNPLWFQFSAHSCWDSFELNGVMHNRYNGQDDGQGIYPQRMDSPLLTRDGPFTRDGYFELSEEGLPLLITSTGKKEVAVDIHRANENRFLKAFHLMALRIHNKRMDVHGNFQLAKEETVALLNLITLNEGKVITRLSTDEFLMDRPVKLLNESLEWVFGIGRWAHAQMPSLVLNEDIFKKGPSIEVDLIRLFDNSSMARKLDLGVSTAMQNMDHVGGEPAIIERTMDRHVALNLPSFQDLAKAFRLPCKVKVKDCPIWFGMLMEAEEEGHGRLGAVGSIAVATGLSQSLAWGKKERKGLWHPLWKGAPVQTLDIIEYSL